MKAVFALSLQLSLGWWVAVVPCAAAPAPLELTAGAVTEPVVAPEPKPEPAAEPQAPCEQAHGQLVCSATYDPTTIDPLLEPVVAAPPGQAGVPGRHYACAPEARRWNGQLLIHLVGTWGNPAASSAFAELACSLGYAAVAPMYENVQDARAVCADDTACYEGMRREVLYGGDSAPAPISVDAANSLLRRVDTLLLHLAARERGFSPWAVIRDRVLARDYSEVALSGHSQGAGHALVWARDHQVARVIMLGGLTDRLRYGTPEHQAVQWVADWAATSKTPSGHLWGYNHSDDKIVLGSHLRANYDVLGVGATCPFSEMGDYPLVCRRIRTPPVGCPALEAHLAVIKHRFGTERAPCQLEGSEQSNAPTWQFLLLAPTM